MPSSTSSSSAGGAASILGMVAVAATLMLAYGLLIQGRDFVVARTNPVTGQRFVANPAAYSTVLVGSSMSHLLPPDAFGPDFYNLSFHGDSLNTGLEVLSRTAARPKTVVMEVNFAIAVPPDEVLLAELFAPTNMLWKTVPALREEYRPVNVIDWAVNQAIAERRRRQGRSAPPTLPPDIMAKKKAEAVAYWANRCKTTDAAVTARFIDAAARVELEIARLRALGTRVFLYRPPVDAVLLATPSIAPLERELTRRFPPERFAWLAFPGGPANETSDGMHMTTTAARLQAEAMAERLR